MRSKKETPEQFSYEEEIIGGSNISYLTLHNDDVHTFDFVIETLMKVCEHDFIQAEQCAYIVHFKGKCEIKKGSLDLLQPMKNKLTSKGLQATID